MKPAHILIIEDDDEARSMYQLLLRRWDYRVTTAANGQEGIAAAKMDPPDLILLDVMMPDMNGYAVCSKLREDPRFGTVPIIYLTVLDSFDARIKAYTTGGDDFLNKGQSTPEEVHVRIQSALNRTQRIQEGIEAGVEGVIVGLYSLRGRTGVSTIATNLAHHAAIHGQQPVILIDLSLPVGYTSIRGGIKGSRHIVELISRSVSELDLALINHFSIQHVNGFFFIPTPSQIVDLRQVQIKALHQLLKILRKEGYFVILDLGGATLPLLWHIPEKCDWVITVTTPESISCELANIAVRSLPEQDVAQNSMLIVSNDIDGRSREDFYDKLPHPPDIKIPYQPNFANLPESHALAELWFLVRHRPR